MKENLEIVIKPKPGWLLLDLSEIWAYRELFWIFAWRDLKVRYKQTMLGAAWAIFQPLFSMFIFTVFFGNIAKIPSGDLPYSLFVLIGLVYWTFFSSVLSNSSNSLIENESIIKKVYFPRLIMPLSKTVTAWIDFAIAFLMLVIVMTFYRVHPSYVNIWIIPVGLLIVSIGSAGLGLFLAAFNVKYRDVRYILPFFIQMLIFLSPVIYPTSIMRPSFRLLMAINPVAGVVEAVRAVISGTGIVPWDTFGISVVSSLVIFLFGLYYFRSTERFFADIA